MKYCPFLVLSLIVASCSSAPNLKKEFKIKTTDLYTLKNPPKVGTTLAKQDVFLGGFSGLMLDKDSNGDIVYKTLTDRGPNGWQMKMDRPFLLPDFSPEIVSFKLNKKKHEIEITSELKLKKKNNSPLTGLPNNRNEENPVDVFDLMYSIDVDGLDTESITSDGEGGYYIGEEYAPSLVHFDANGKMLKRFVPGNELPKIYSERKTNRGFEGIARIDNKLYGMLQSPLKSDKDFTRIVELDLETFKTSGEYFYPNEIGVDKIGDMTPLPDHSMLVIEQNGKTGDESFKKIYRITLNGSDEKVSKTLLVDLDKTPFREHEKIEGMAIVDATHIAIVNDNDFKISGTTDIKSGKTEMGEDESQMLILELENKLY
jgi:hypothetical protein